MSGNDKILIVGPSWVGDMMMAQTLFADLKASRPGSGIDVLAPAWSAGVVEKMPEVDGLLESPFTHGRLDLAKRRRLARSLSSRSYTHAIVLPNSWKSALVPALAGVPARTGFLGEQRWGLLNDVRHLDKKELPLMIQRFVALGRGRGEPAPARSSISMPRLSVDNDRARDVAARFGTKTGGMPLLLLCPGSEFGNAKQWPLEQYALVAQHYLGEHWQVAIIGSENDAEDGNRITSIAGEQVNNLAGKTSLGEAAEILSLANLVVTNDSGLMHIASAVGVPVVAIFGSTNPGFTPPLGARSTVVRLGLECSPCFKRECPLGHLDCLKKIDAGTVIRSAQELLRDTS